MDLQTFPHVPIDSNNIFAVPSRPSPIVSSNLKSRRKIPNHTDHVRLPSIRKVPSNLYVTASSQSKDRRVLPTSSPQVTLMCGQLKTFPGSTSKHETHPGFTQASVLEKLAPISIPEMKWMASASSPPAGVFVATITIPKFLPTFIDILTENKHRNRYAPTMVSMSNPLRDKVPSRAWVHLPCNEHGQVPSGSFFLPSPRFKRLLGNRLTRSRSECEWESNDLEHGKAYWFKKTRTHCHFCKQESLRTKLLVISHYQRQSRELWSPQYEGNGDIDRKNQTTLNNGDPLDSPRLRDLDDFDDFDGDVDDAFADALFEEILFGDDIDNRFND